MPSDRLLRNHQLSTAIIDLIDDAEEYVFLVTPYFRPWPLLIRSLATAAKKNKNIVVILRSIPDNYNIADELNVEYGFDVVLISNLHTKLYLNEKAVIFGSMNLYDVSKENNYEIGYQINNRKTAAEFRKKIISEDLLSLPPDAFKRGRYARALSEEKKEQLEKQAKVAEAKAAAAQRGAAGSYKSSGYCIRCGTSIPTSNVAVLCDDCYQIWAIFLNEDYPERYCHTCGIEVETSKRRPLCDSCYRIK